MALHHVADIGDLQEGQRKLVTIGKQQIGIFHEEGKYYAVLNVCPHAYAPVCEGKVEAPLMAEVVGSQPSAVYELDSGRRVLRCPWHHWEFELNSGKPVCSGIKMRLRTYTVHQQDGRLYVEV
ncbi:Rieske (2Fe-2S) protein [Paenibacillus roseipurpureus]|uniref:Rieske (2Fe-2S) protein n=1 Tax=Paenibacillus roseopurpureus TaxID=2918901 RepID=A0AA96RLT7_9BACL|nr:Rieske (2Fe-2S) protein [Paenibacillus sp. MBLB1832]WNR45756.1 Rieske (2Fe-2S) protein [Paenibacillus sp. MBLB1832]